MSNPPFYLEHAMYAGRSAPAFLSRHLVDVLPQESRFHTVRKAFILFAGGSVAQSGHDRAETLRQKGITTCVKAGAIAHMLLDDSRGAATSPELLEGDDERRRRHVAEVVDEPYEVGRGILANVSLQPLVQLGEVVVPEVAWRGLAPCIEPAVQKKRPVGPLLNQLSNIFLHFSSLFPFNGLRLNINNKLKMSMY